MEGTANGEEPTSWEELYNINLMPSEIFLKFRKEIEGFRVGVNLELYNAPLNDYHAKLVLKPLAHERRWKVSYEPLHQDVQLVSKKIPITKYLNLQVGVGHSFQLHATGWKWKLTTCLGGDGISRIRNKTSLGLCPGVDFRFGWRADYVLPEFTGGVGTDEPLFNMNSGRLQASLDRIEAIFTHTDARLPVSTLFFSGQQQQRILNMPVQLKLRLPDSINLFWSSLRPPVKLSRHVHM